LGLKDAENAIKMGKTYSVNDNIIHFDPNSTWQAINKTATKDIYND
jgi:hypothetical protein